MNCHPSLLPVLSIAVLGALAAACSASPSAPGVRIASSDLKRDMKPNVPAGDATALVSGNSAFAMDAYRSIGAGAATSNVFFSPYSISSALAMTYAGAGGATEAEMASALHFTLPQAQLHPAFNGLDLELASRAKAPTQNNAKPVQLHIANALWGEDKETFGKPFLDTLAQNYGAGIRLVDFLHDPDGCRKQINDWVGGETNQKILDLIGPGAVGDSTRLVLVNAIYFDGNWATKFEKDATQAAPFTKLDGGTVSVAMMSNAAFPGSYAQTDSYDAVELPYAGNQIAMDVVMPKAGTFATFESALTGDSLAAIFSGMKGGTVVLSVPKFKIAGSTVSLKPLLQSFGMKTAFSDGADFTAMAPKGALFISDVLHKAYVNVDEDGTEAAAATAVVMNDSAIGPAPSAPTIKVDHAFFFVLRDVPTGAILFAGRVADPTST